MPTLKSSVLILHHPSPSQNHLGADVLEDLDAAITALKSHNYQVIVISLDFLQPGELRSLLQVIDLHRPLVQKICIDSSSDLDKLLTFLDSGQAFKILPNHSEPELSQAIQEALSEFTSFQQNQELLGLVRDQHEQLKHLRVQLEARVKKREGYLTTTHERLINTSRRVEALHSALMAVHQAETVTDMEKSIQQALKNAVTVTWIRILFPNQSYLEHSDAFTGSDYCVLSTPLMKNHEQIGHIYFARSQQQPFNHEEEQFLLQISNAVALAVDRLNQLDNIENIKRQWDGTFDAISSPVSLVDEHYKIIRANQALTKKAGVSSTEIIGRECFSALFERTTPCDGCFLGENFRITNLSHEDSNEGGWGVETVDVKSQILPFSSPGNSYYVNFYKDVSSQLRMERQIIHSAKMAELGTIGSSIAHEINNPLAGLLSFIQIIKMDLLGNEPHFEDIIEMEKGALRCKSIVQNLLDFSRQTNLDEQVRIDLREVLSQSIKITEIQTRSKGIAIHLGELPTPIWVKGNITQLSQAIRNLLQNANEAIIQRLNAEPALVGRIEIDIERQSERVLITISDNGIGISPITLRRAFNPMFTTKDPNLNPGLGLTTARQIVAEHGGSLEIYSDTRRRTRAIISLPALKALD